MGLYSNMSNYKHKIISYSKWFGFVNAIIFVLSEMFNVSTKKIITVGGEKIMVRTGTSDIYVAAGCLADKVYEVIKCEDARIIIDAGANIGASSIFFAKKYPSAIIFSIEPESSNFELLLENVKLYKNVLPIKAALWDEECIKILKDRRTGAWGYTVSGECNDHSGTTGQQIECISMEKLIREHNLDSIDIFKIDIEGGEKKVFESSDAWIGKVNIIAAELHDRICMGCDRAFYIATKDFHKFEKVSDIVIAYRKNN